jgi:hypothetical protein
MLHLNSIFQAEGLDPDRIQLIRHKDARLKGKSLFDVWFSERAKFEAYQSVQGPKNAFNVGGLVASFVVTPLNETVFVGLYETVGRKRAHEGERLPILDMLINQTDYIHDLRLQSNVMVDYVGRLVIEPWKDAINFVQKASARNPKLLEIKRYLQELPFPGPLSFSRHVSDLPGIFPTWKDALARAKGVYLLVDQENGGQYIGSATGEQGFLGRWLAYAKDGHGGNAILKLRNHKNYVVSILETAGSAMDRNAILAREEFWKEKLGSRAARLGDEFGLNAN